jgi:hypothetical protein
MYKCGGQTRTDMTVTAMITVHAKDSADAMSMTFPPTRAATTGGRVKARTAAKPKITSLLVIGGYCFAFNQLALGPDRGRSTERGLLRA